MEDKALKLQLSQTATAFTDGINIATRMDGCVLLQFISGTPDRIIENFRTIMTKEGATNLLDNLSKALNHYPTKEAEPARKTKVKANKSVDTSK